MKKVVVASAPWCQNCGTVKQLLKNKGIQFTEVNIAEEMEYAKQYRIRSVPTTLVISDIEVKQFSGIVNVEDIESELNA